MSNSVIKYGDAISLQNKYGNWNGGYLAVGPADLADPTTHVKWTTVTVNTPTLRGEQTPNMAVGLWQVLHIDGTSDGAEVKNGDIVALKNLHACDGSWLGAYNDASLASHPNALYRANTRTFEVPSKPAVQWQITIPDELPGTSVTENKLVVLINQFTYPPHGTSFLDINLVPKADEKIGEGYFVFTSDDKSRQKDTGLWRMNCVPNPCLPSSPQPDPCHKDEPCSNGKCGGKCGDSSQGGRQCFSLPAKIKFGLNVLINSGITQTIKVFIDDKQVDTLTGSGVENVNPGAKIYNSGSGKVCIEVWARGKMSPLRYADNPLDNKPGMAIIGTEDGSDNDYNDAIVILNWPLV